MPFPAKHDKRHNGGQEIENDEKMFGAELTRAEVGSIEYIKLSGGDVLFLASNSVFKFSSEGHFMTETFLEE